MDHNCKGHSFLMLYNQRLSSWVRHIPSNIMTSSNGKIFKRYWPFVWGIHRPLVNSPHKCQWRGALMFSLICACINGWVNNRKAGDLRRHRAHFDVTARNQDIHNCVLTHVWNAGKHKWLWYWLRKIKRSIGTEHLGDKKPYLCSWMLL